jgi:hypothetical protein
VCCSIEIKAGNPFPDSVLKQLLVRRPSIEIEKDWIGLRMDGSR